MTFGRRAMAIAALTVMIQMVVGHVGVGIAQTYSSGSTGADGPFNPPASVPSGTTISGSIVTVPLPPSGIFNFQTVTVGSGLTVRFVKNTANTPVTILATGDITIAGTIDVNGRDGQGPQQNSATAVSVGGEGGPGGYRGGNGSSRDFTVPAAAGQGPGGGTAAPSTLNTCGGAATYGSSGGFPGLPLVGGSGGGGGATSTANGVPTFSGGGGGGGGGAIVMASSTRIVLTGVVTANGGFGACGSGPSRGSGGAIRLVAPLITGAGSLSAIAGPIFGQPSEIGRVRLEAFTNTFSGTSTPGPSVVPSPGPVTAASNPALINLPSLTISAVGGVSTPANAGGSYGAADIALSAGTTNPVPVEVTAANLPLSTAVTVKVVPVAGGASTFSVGALSGTLAQSTGSADVTLPTGGIVSVVQAFASFTLTAGLFPLIEGEEVERVLMAAGVGEPSQLTLVTTSGKAVPLSQLSPRDQQQVATAFEAMRNETR